MPFLSAFKRSSALISKEINGEDIRQMGGLQAIVDDGSDVRIIPSIAGGLDSNDLNSNELVNNSSIISYFESFEDQNGIFS